MPLFCTLIAPLRLTMPYQYGRPDPHFPIGQHEKRCHFITDPAVEDSGRVIIVRPFEDPAGTTVIGVKGAGFPQSVSFRILIINILFLECFYDYCIFA